jgi:hypothetical protein
MTGGTPATGGSGTGTGGSTATGGTTTTTGGTTTASGGKAATGGVAATGGSGGAVISGDQSVLERNKNPSRDGHFIQAGLSKDKAKTMAWDSNFKTSFKGTVYASPLYMQNGPGGKGAFFVVTTGNDVIAIDETTGATIWTKNIGSAPSQTGAGCGMSQPGLLSTPVIDATTRTIYVAGAIGTTSIMRHEAHALSIEDGTEKTGWPVDMAGMKSGSVTFNPTPQNQRSALSLVNGTLYVAYGGHVGDCGDYHGWVIGIDTTDPTKKGGWATLGKGEAIWAAGGLASDGNGVFAVTGNSTSSASSRTASDSEQVVRITGLGAFTRDNANLYYPASWKSMDSSDADFGASNPIYITKPAKYVVAIAKDGHFYLLDPANLGGMGGHVVDFPVSTGAMSVKTAPAAYTTSKGTHIVFSTESGAMCPGGAASGKNIVSVIVPTSSPVTPTIAWCAPMAGDRNSQTTSPIATTTDGTNEAIVWYMNNGKLAGVDGDTGAVIFAGGSNTCAGVQRWTSPIAVKNRIIAVGNGLGCSWSAP